MAKFKVGDKVKILDGSYIEGYRGIWVSKAMEEFTKLAAEMFSG